MMNFGAVFKNVLLEPLIREPGSRKRKYRMKRPLTPKKWPSLISVISIRESGEPDSGSVGSPINSSCGSSGHKPSFKASGKLARRARSFKEDFLEKLGAMRSPTTGGASPGGGVRSHSPAPKEHKRPPSNAHAPPSTPSPTGNKDRQTSTLDGLLRQVDVALKHFRDVITKNKLEMLPGNGTIVIEAVQKVLFAALGGVASQTGAALGGATGHTCACLTRLVKLCDDVLVNGDHSAELQPENVHEIVNLLEQSVKELITLTRERRTIQKEALLPPISHINSQQRNSLPDIALARDEQNILETQNSNSEKFSNQNVQNSRLSRTSHSTESILRDSSPPPPPKPPHPHRPHPQLTETTIVTSSIPPPLPPKRRSQKLHNDINHMEMGASSLLHAACVSLERVSLRSRSPDETSSLLSGSLDSVLNNSREDDEIHALMSDHFSNNDGGTRENDLVDHSSFEISYNHLEETQTFESNILDNNRLSNTDSGFVSLHSQRGSRGVEGVAPDDIAPPPVPQKHRINKYQRQPSPYDNILITCLQHNSQNFNENNENLPPPLPVKKRHIMAYMEMFGNCAHSVSIEGAPNSLNNEYIRHSVHLVQNWGAQSVDSGLTSTMSCNFVQNTQISSSYSINGEIKPALPPKIRKNNVTPPLKAGLTITPPITPPKTPPTITSTPLLPKTPPLRIETPPSTDEITNHDEVLPSNDVAIKQTRSNTPVNNNHAPSPDTSNQEPDLIEMIEINEYLVFKKVSEDGPDLKGGFLDALIVHATKCNKKGDKDSDYSYQEAFLTTYRTFISSNELVDKLIRRYQFFACQPDKKPRARESFSLLLAVVNDLTAVDLEENLSKNLMEFIYQLLSGGNLDLAKPLREKLVDKYIKRKNYLNILKKGPQQETSLNLAAGSLTLLDFKSVEIAEQMTLLDANLFMKIEIPEVLIWAQEQNEERSPNLTKFTEHFNKMSYWARTKILSIPEAKDREKFVMKFIKIMKYLRKMNNFNSYLALLSALDSAPITRLEWQKHITEGLKEYCALIDSSSSFRAYRQALADTTPPCIPYIGLVLQDLTFVHIGNSNILGENGMINFSKRWQQFNILENMKKFKKCNYPFKRNEKIIAFFDDFQENIGEDAMWQLSESYKPRGKKTNQS